MYIRAWQWLPWQIRKGKVIRPLSRLGAQTQPDSLPCQSLSCSRRIFCTLSHRRYTFSQKSQPLATIKYAQNYILQTPMLWEFGTPCSKKSCCVLSKRLFYLQNLILHCDMVQNKVIYYVYNLTKTRVALPWPFSQPVHCHTLQNKQEI